MNYWIVKTEPESYSWADFLKEGGTSWTGVRNYQARRNLKAMKKGDSVFFYHSVSEKRIVGIAKVERENFPDPTADAPEWVAVGLVPVQPLARPVTLEDIKADPAFNGIPLLRNPRLSVTPLTDEQGRRVIHLSEMK